MSDAVPSRLVKTLDDEFSHACVRLERDGTAHVKTGSSDIGPGTYTVMTQIAADALGLPVSRVAAGRLTGTSPSDAGRSTG